MSAVPRDINGFRISRGLYSITFSACAQQARAACMCLGHAKESQRSFALFSWNVSRIRRRSSSSRRAGGEDNRCRRLSLHSLISHLFCSMIADSSPEDSSVSAVRTSILTHNAERRKVGVYRGYVLYVMPSCKHQEDMQHTAESLEIAECPVLFVLHLPAASGLPWNGPSGCIWLYVWL